MRLLACSCLLPAALAVAVPALAQEAATDDEIVVTGSSKADRAGQIRAFLGTVAPLRRRGHLARFEYPVCPIAVGLSPQDNRAVVERLRRVAGAVGLPVGKASCRPNLLIAVVIDKRAFLEGLVRKQPSLFASLTPREVRLLTRDPKPVVTWQQTGWISVKGNEIMLDAAYDVPVNVTYGTSPTFTEPAHLHFTASAVVIEAEAAAGLTTTQVADYAAMRGFARTDPSSLSGSEPTILKAVGAPPGTEVPVTLTSWDLGFLRGLYASANDVNALVRSAEIARSIEQELDRAASHGKLER